MNPSIFRISSPLLLVLGLVCFSQPSAAQDRLPSHVDGWLIVEWGDPPPGSVERPVRRVLLGDASGRHRRLVVSEELARGNLTLWHGRRVRVFSRNNAKVKPFSTAPLRVAAVQLLADDRAGSPARKAVVGPQPWISIPCKFSDIATEPKSLSFFEGMYANSSGRLDHYWREVSNDTINVVGSIAIDWLVLPFPQSHYVPKAGSGRDADLNAVFDDCTAAADPFVDFSNGGNPFVGINIMLNDLLDCCAWGGGRFATLDGVAKVWRTTWDPPWAFGNIAVIKHEMGHGFGLPHSTNWDDDGYPYDSPWDVMSSATDIYSPLDATYGRLGKHTIGYHKETLGWIPAAQKRVVPENDMVSIVLDDTVQNDTPNYRLVELPLGDGSTWYTVEARKRRGVYESALLDEAVLIYHIDPTRPEDGWLYDADVPPADYANNEGSMWKVGEVFEDAANQIKISIDAATTDGFLITVDRRSPIFTDGFESGDLISWSITAP